jgi:hypothetical protein
MSFRIRALLGAAAVGAFAFPVWAQQTGPVATYWVGASTTSGMGAGYAAAPQARAAPQQAPRPKPKRSGFGAALGGIAGAVTGLPIGGGASTGSDDEEAARVAAGYPQAGGGAVRMLELQLGSTQKPSGPPQADHFIPAGLAMGPSLPLLTPMQARPEPTEGMPPQAMGERPRGKMIIYWGCGEHAAAAPIVIDFAVLGQGKAPAFPILAVNSPRPPSAGRFATYGEWPNERDSHVVPANASLVGDHAVRGDYSPEIRFQLGANQDFMAPLALATEPTPAGGSRMSWNAVPNATGYFAWFMGSADAGRGGDSTMVLWTSSAQAVAFGELMDYLPPSEVRRLIASKTVMPPSTTQCVVPTEVMKSGAAGLLSMIAYGDEADFADPPRPKDPKAAWNLKSVVKVRYKSTTSTMLGAALGGG